jgi:hypothetical protein
MDTRQTSTYGDCPITFRIPMVELLPPMHRQFSSLLLIKDAKGGREYEHTEKNAQKARPHLAHGTRTQSCQLSKLGWNGAIHFRSREPQVLCTNGREECKTSTRKEYGFHIPLTGTKILSKLGGNSTAKIVALELNKHCGTKSCVRYDCVLNECTRK